jgi:anti-sigma factor RsiW
MSGDHRHEDLSALLDGELPPAEAAAVTAHLARCPDCARHLEELASLRAAIATLDQDDISPALEQRIHALLDDAPPGRVLPFRAVRRRPAFIAAAAGLAAVLVLTLSLGHDHTADFVAVRDAGLRSGLTQTAAATVTAPALPGFTLVAARPDILAGHQARVLTYDRDGAAITLCIWSAGREPAHGVRRGTYRGTSITYWNDGKNEYWVASTAPAPLVSAFVAALRGVS